MANSDPHTSSQMLSAIILAAGLSRRMGAENKLLLPHKNSSLVNETIRQLSQAKGIYEIILVLGHQADLIKDQLTEQSASVALNPDFATGQTSSIQTGIRACSPNASGYMICLGDMPFIKYQDYEQLIQFWKTTAPLNIVRPVVHHQPGHPVIFPANYKEALLTETEADGCRQVIIKHKPNLIQYVTSINHFISDIDTQEDKRKLK